MKQLSFEISLSEHHENHTIYLGNKESLKHKSKTFLKMYLRTYKKVLLDNVRILNAYNSQVYTLYRTFFFDLSNREVGAITEMFENFNGSFNWIFDNIGGKGDQNGIIFAKINHCLIAMDSILEVLKSNAQLHKNYSLKNQSESYLKMLSDFEDKFNKEKRSLDLNRDYTKKNLKVISNELKKQA